MTEMDLLWLKLKEQNVSTQAILSGDWRYDLPHHCSSISKEKRWALVFLQACRESTWQEFRESEISSLPGSEIILVVQLFPWKVKERFRLIAVISPVDCRQPRALHAHSLQDRIPCVTGGKIFAMCFVSVSSTSVFESSQLSNWCWNALSLAWYFKINLAIA